MKSNNGHPSSEKLSAFLDGDLGRREVRAVAEHLENCPACRAQLDEFEGMKNRLAALGAEEAPESLWWKVRAAVNEKVAGRRAAGRRRWPGYLAAFATTAAGLCWIAFVWLRPPAPEEPATPEVALRAVQDAEVQYMKAIDSLSAALDKRQQEQTPEVQRALAENLAAIDRAIGDFRKLLRDRPDDLESQRAMLALYQRKVDLLTDIVLETPGSP